MNNKKSSKKWINNLNLKRKKFRPVVRKLLSVLKPASQTILNPGIRSRSSTIFFYLYISVTCEINMVGQRQSTQKMRMDLANTLKPELDL